jgi:hypothetical protein
LARRGYEHPALRQASRCARPTWTTLSGQRIRNAPGRNTRKITPFKTTLSLTAPPGTGFGALFGIRVHTDFANKVRALDLPGIGNDGVEQSFSMGSLVRYGAANIIRTDIFLRDRSGEPLAIYDLKTGNASLTPARVRELLKRVGREGMPVPVIQLNFSAGTAIVP